MYFWLLLQIYTAFVLQGHICIIGVRAVWVCQWSILTYFIENKKSGVETFLLVNFTINYKEMPGNQSNSKCSQNFS